MEPINFNRSAAAKIQLKLKKLIGFQSEVTPKAEQEAVILIGE